MKHFRQFTVVLAFLTLPVVVFAETNNVGGALQSLATIEDNSKLLEIVSLWSTLVVAFATSLLVLLAGRKMHGGLFGSVLTFFSIGMIFVFIGFVVSVLPLKKIDPLYVKMTHDSLYILGYIIMGIAANKLTKVING